jgi:Fe-S-cluster containining protein
VPLEQPGGFASTERVLPYRHGRCAFLGEDDRCTIYDDRPANCRRFQCISGYNPSYYPDQSDQVGRHSPFLNRNPAVLAMLESLEALPSRISSRH